MGEVSDRKDMGSTHITRVAGSVAPAALAARVVWHAPGKSFTPGTHASTMTHRKVAPVDPRDELAAVGGGNAVQRRKRVWGRRRRGDGNETQARRRRQVCRYEVDNQRPDRLARARAQRHGRRRARQVRVESRAAGEGVGWR